MNVLLIGSGGREHALAWKLSQSPRLDKLFAAPGNPGIATWAQILDLAVDDHNAVIGFCRQARIGLVVIGPELPLVTGLADELRREGVKVFGPNKLAARLEGSKGFTKDLCARHGLPTAGYARAEDARAAKALLAGFGIPVVIKADGLAAGKGVVIAETFAQAEAAIDDMFGGDFGGAGASVVIEEFLQGEEASFFALTDGKDVISFGSAQDHKRVGDGDVGPNTGGMGAYSPASILTADLEERAMAEILRPTVRAMAQEGAPYSGILYAGLMLTPEGPKLIEYNARFGDPECQVLMMRLESDLLEIALATAEGRLAGLERPRFSRDAALTVVIAADGYPGTPEKGRPIEGLEEAEAEGAMIFHAGTSMEGGVLVANGGRVLNVTARGSDVAQAQERAYRAVARIRLPGGFCRRDIGWREIARRDGEKASRDH